MADSGRHLEVEREDGILTLVMNRPEARNALSPQMLVQLAEAWYEFRDTKDLRVAILTGSGERDFCAGGDLALTMPLITGARQPEDEWDERLLSNLTLFTDAIEVTLDRFLSVVPWPPPQSPPTPPPRTAPTP